MRVVENLDIKAKTNIRAIAFYLPQYYPIPENDLWWGKGFTEWTNVTKAKPLFRNHYQPHLPADLGFYDLRVSETRQAQAEMAKSYGIEGFCYWHYWFGNGKKLLNRPFEEVLATKTPDFPFCLGWANETWSGIWHGDPNKVLIEQTYPGVQDYINHFNHLLNAFKDSRYIKVDDKPLFYIYSPEKIPNIIEFTSLFRKLALENDLKGLYIVANTGNPDWNPEINGCDAVCLNELGSIYKYLPRKENYFYRKFRNQLLKPRFGNLYKKIFRLPVKIYSYKETIKFLVNHKHFAYKYFPTVIPNWDNSPRSGLNSLILTGSTPQLFKEHLEDAINIVKNNPPDQQIVFIKSWNEWAEGNHLEPDVKFGHQYLEVLKELL